MWRHILIGISCILFIIISAIFIYCHFPTPPKNQPPIAVIDPLADPDNLFIGDHIKMSGKKSNDPDNYPSEGKLSFYWQVDSIGTMQFPDFSDSSSIIYIPRDSGRHTVTLTVSDSKNRSHPATCTFNVKSHPYSPVASIAVSSDTAFIGQTITLSGANSFDPNNGIEDLTFLWTNLNNPNAQYASAIEIQFTPDAAGVYNFMLVVSDPDSHKSAPALSRIVVVERVFQTPVIVTEPDSVLFTKVNKRAQISATRSYSPDKNPLIFLWELAGAGEIVGQNDNPIVEVSSNQVGISLLKLTVTDSVTQALARKIIKVDFSDSVNLPPVADAGRDTTTFRHHKVVLDAKNSYDPESDPLAYKWIPPQGIENQLSGLNEQQLIFNPLHLGAYSFKLQVSERTNPHKVDSDEITVNVENQRPIARASIKPATIEIGQTALLSAAESSDPDGDALLFSWNSFQKGAIVDTLAEQTEFTTSIPGTHAILLTVNDGFDGIDSDIIDITVKSSQDTSVIIPVVEIEGPGKMMIGEQVELISNVSNADPSSLTYAWQAMNGGRVFTPNQPRTLFSSDSSGLFYIRLVVSNNLGISASDLHEISVEPYTPPTILINGIRERIKIGELMPLDACATESGYGRALDFRWTSKYGVLTNPNSCRTTYSCERETNDIITLRVIDTERDVSDSLTFVVAILPNQNPVAFIHSASNSTYLSVPVELDGSYSADPDGDSLTFEWSVQMNDGQFIRVAESGKKFTFIPPERGDAVIQLLVTDPYGATAADREDIQVLNRPPVAVARVPEKLAVGEEGSLDASGSYDDDGDRLDFFWESVAGEGVIRNENLEIAHFSASEPGRYVVKLTVNDKYDVRSKSIDIKPIDVYSTNNRPTAHAGNDTIVFIGQTVPLQGVGTDLDENDDLTYHWATLADGDIEEANAQNTYYHPNVTGDHYVYLIVSDGVLESEPDYKRITVMDSTRHYTAPVAVLSESLTVRFNKTVVLDASESRDTNENENFQLAYHWTQDANNPQQVPLHDSSMIHLRPPLQPGNYIFRLQVDNGHLPSSWASTRLRVRKPDIYVTQNTNPNIIFDSRTIQQAIQNASDGDSIFIDKGTYFENLEIPAEKNKIKLIGLDREQTQIDGGNKGENTIQFDKADSILIQGLLISNGGININAKSPSSFNSYNLLRGNRIQDRVRSGSHLEIMNSTNIVIEDNIFLRSGGGIHCKSNYSIEIHVINNEFYGLSGSPIFCEEPPNYKPGNSIVNWHIKGNRFSHRDIDDNKVDSDPQSALSLSWCVGEIDSNNFKHFTLKEKPAIVLKNSVFVIRNNNTFLDNAVDLKIDASEWKFCPDICDWVSSIKVQYGNLRCCN